MNANLLNIMSKQIEACAMQLTAIREQMKSISDTGTVAGPEIALMSKPIESAAVVQDDAIPTVITKKCVQQAMKLPKKVLKHEEVVGGKHMTAQNYLIKRLGVKPTRGQLVSFSRMMKYLEARNNWRRPGQCYVVGGNCRVYTKATLERSYAQWLAKRYV